MTRENRGSLTRLIKLVISMGFFAASWGWNVIRRLAKKGGRGTCVVLYYHAVPSEHRKHFACQMDILVRYTKPVRVDTNSPLAEGGAYSAVTFDDGYESVIENALPELETRGIPSTIFVVTEALGQLPCWLTHSSPDRKCQDRILSADQLRKASSSPLVTIGSHSMTHPSIPSLSEEEARQELVGSRVRLEKMVKKEVSLFSFPYGAFNEDLVEWCAEAGYKRVFTVLPVLAFTDSQEFLTGRVWAEPTDWPLEFRFKLLGAYRWLPVAFALKRKVLSIVSAVLRLGAQTQGQVVPYVSHRK